MNAPMNAMTALTRWLSPQTLHALGWALLHFLWQGTALAALAAVSMAACRNAATRYRVGVGVLLLMLVAPIATFVAQTSSPYRQRQIFYVARSAAQSHAPAILGSQISSSPDTLRWLVEAWLIGVMAFSFRSAGGFVLLERERRQRFSSVPGSLFEICITLQRRLGIDRAIRYRQCQRLQSPAVLGWLRPIVMLPASALTGLSPDQLQSVIAHELAHIKRLDSFVNVFQICVETLLFYHPAVWWLNRRIRTEREHCCDDIAVSICGNPLEYARALTLMEQWRSAPVLAMAATGGSLSARICRLLGLKAAGSNMRNAGITASVLCLTTALIAGNAFLGVAHPHSSVHAAIRSVIPEAVIDFQAAVPSTAASKPSPAHSSTAAEPPVSASSYIEALQAVGLTNLTADQLIALKVQDVTPAYIHGLNQQGIHPTVDEIIAMRVQGVTPEYIHDLRVLGIDADATQVISLKVQDVTPEYVRALKDAGLDPDAERLVSLKVQGVTPEYVRELKAAGLGTDAEKIIGMKVQDVTPEYVRAIRALGLNPTADQIISMKVQDVTAEYVKALQAAGFKVDVNDVIRAKVQDLTPEFIESARKHGFQNLTLEKLLQLKRLGVLEAPADI
jgi:beta-lactamase regulating signal transducer with metallopeptidase domain